MSYVLGGGFDQGWSDDETGASKPGATYCDAERAEEVSTIDLCRFFHGSFSPL
jgi:hypothetical protein